MITAHVRWRLEALAFILLQKVTERQKLKCTVYNKYTASCVGICIPAMCTITMIVSRTLNIPGKVTPEGTQLLTFMGGYKYADHSFCADLAF